MRLLFVTWDGPQVTYLEGLFLPIFVGLREHGIAVDVLQFRWGSPEQEAAVRMRVASAGIGYRAVTIERPGALGALVGAGISGPGHVRAAIADFGSRLVMPRSLMPALAVLRCGVERLPPVIFDADGLSADEKVEFGALSRYGAAYRVLREIERRMCRHSRAVLIRTPAAAEVLRARSDCPPERFRVVTNGRDPECFRPLAPADRLKVRAELGIPANSPLIVYAGSIGPQYRLSDMFQMVEHTVARAPDTHFLMLTGAPELAATQLAAYPRLLPLTRIEKHPAEAVPRLLGAADLGLAYRERRFSMQGIAPVKLSEYLLCGLAVVGTSGIGKTSSAQEAGVFFDEDQGPAAAAAWFVEQVRPRQAEMRDKARHVGLSEFSLDRSVQDYLAAIELQRYASRRSSR